MAKWKSLLREDQTGWMLEEDNPSVRYFALEEIVGLSPSHPKVKEARKNLMRFGPVPAILKRQNLEGYWGKQEDFYLRAKYKGTVWQLITLASLGADGEDERVRKACEFILSNSQDSDSGGFAYRSSGSGGNHDSVIPCLTSNMVWSLMNLGYDKDERVARGISWLMKYQKFGEEEVPNEWPFNHRRCWTPHTCRSAAVKSLKAMISIPIESQTRAIRNQIETGADYILETCLENGVKGARPEWLHFGFPLMWNTDLLEILDVLLVAGYRDDRMRWAVDYVASKQDPMGKWGLETTYNGRVQANIEKKGQQSKWITLRAMKVLKNFYS